MSDWVWEVLKLLGSLFGGGVIGTLFGPTARDRFTHKRERRQRRRALVDGWRTGISQAEADLKRENMATFANPAGAAMLKLARRGPLPFATTPWYASLEPYLTEMRRDFVRRPKKADEAAQLDVLRMLSRAVDRIATRWKVD